MHKVQRMEQHPTTCLYCGRGNTPDDPDTMDDFWALDLERDVNWGDSTYLCKYCCEKLAATCGFSSPDDMEEMAQMVRSLQRRVHDLEAGNEAKQRRLDRIASGQQAIRATRKDAARQGKPVKKKRKKKVTP